MEAKLKAREIFEKYYDLDEFYVQCSPYCYGGSIDKKAAAKACALICVYEILKTYDKNSEEFIANNGGEINYWLSVKSEIEKL